MSDEVARTMGRGLTRLESYLPSMRGATLFGELKRMLDQPGAAQRVVDTAAQAGTVGAGRLAQALNENSRSFWERHIHLSARKRAEEAQRVEALAQLGGIVGSFLAGKAVQVVDRKNREAVGRVVWHVVSYAARAEDGTINEWNMALRWRVIDALQLTPRARAALTAAPLPSSLDGLQIPDLDTASLEAVATYAFHAKANEVGENDALRDITPFLVRLGMTRSAGDHFARAAREEYLSERASLTKHYRALQAGVAGIGRHLHLPYDVIAEAARRVVMYDPYEAARVENRRVLANLLRSSGSMAAALAGGHVGPAMSIVTAAAQQLFGAATKPAIEASFVSFGQEAKLPPEAVKSWISWNQ